MKLISTIRFVFVCILSGFVGQLVAQTPLWKLWGVGGLTKWHGIRNSLLYRVQWCHTVFPANKAQDFGGVVISPGFFERRKTSAGGVVSGFPWICGNL